MDGNAQVRPGALWGLAGCGARGTDLARGCWARGAGQRPPAPLPTLRMACPAGPRRASISRLGEDSGVTRSGQASGSPPPGQRQRRHGHWLSNAQSRQTGQWGSAHCWTLRPFLSRSLRERVDRAWPRNKRSESHGIRINPEVRTAEPPVRCCGAGPLPAQPPPPNTAG